MLLVAPDVGSVSPKNTMRTTHVGGLVVWLDLTDFRERHEGGGWGDKPCVVVPAHVVV